MSRPSKRQGLGFTLVEVLLILTLIVTLALFLTALLSRVHERGNTATCQSNLHQISLAMQQYVSDNNGLYPALWGERGEQWPSAITTYIGGTKVFQCPTHTEHLQFDTDYAYNWQQLSARKSPFFGTYESRVTNPVQTWVHQDASWQNGDGRLVYESLDGSCQGHQWMTNLHTGGANFSFADGHVKWLSTTQQEEKFCRSKVQNTG